MTGKRMGAEGDPTTITVHADVYTQEAPSTSEHEFRLDLRNMQQVSFYSTLTAEERARTHPFKKTRCVIMSSGEPSPPAQASISTTSFDVLDNARLINAAPITSQPSKPSGDNTDTEAIEEAVPIVQTTLPVPESKPEIEKNGLDVNTKKSPDEPDVSCLINCLYYTQQCCDCTIV